MAKRTIVLTVGTGNERDLEASILSPFRKSLGEGRWEQVVLLPSRATIRLAEMVRADHPELAGRIRIEPLPELDWEYDLDRCFGHFQRVLLVLLESGCGAASIIVDLTRGTKAMSAALALAAVSVGINTIRYIEGTAKDHNGITIAGTERVSDISAGTVARARTLSLAESFLREGQFSAASRLLGADKELVTHPQYGLAARRLEWAARFWGKWDHLDYQGAQECLSWLRDCGRVSGMHEDFVPSEAQRKLLSELARSAPADAAAHVPLCRALTADLLANARRRLAQGQTEEALVRVGRVIELVGQTRLFTYGFNSSAVPVDDERVAPWIEKQKKQNRFVEVRNGKAVLARRKVVSLLKHLGDRMAEKLNKLDSWLEDFDIESRNHSVLIHGFVARSAGLSGRISEWIEKLEELHRNEDAPGNAALIAAARFRFFPSS
jgi:CRISPR-associated protein (TIGR02710 family)